MSNINPSPSNTPITLTATIQESAPETPTGTITFRDGTATLATVPVDNNQATFTTSTLAVGSHDITASYSGDANFAATQSAVLVQQVNPVTITLTPPTLAAGKVGAAYNQSIAASGGTAPYTYTITAGALPPGLTLHPTTGALTGTPSAGGSFAFTLTVTDSTSQSAEQAYTLAIEAAEITITPTTLPAATRGFAVNTTFTAAGSIGPYSFALAPGSALPSGVTLSSTGMLSGVPTQVGTFNFTVRATDSATGTGPYTGTRAMTLTVNAATITLTPTTLPAVLQGVPYTQTLAATGGVAPYSFALTTGTLPAGLTLNASGTISGMPNTAGSFSFTATATDAFGNTGTAAISLAVTARPNPALDADIRGFIASEDSLAQRFAWTQLGNFQSRFDALHDGGSGRGTGGMRLASRIMDDSIDQWDRGAGLFGSSGRGDTFGPAYGAPHGTAARLGSNLDLFAADYGWNAVPDEGEDDMRTSTLGQTMAAFGPRETGTWDVWTGGTLGIGRRDGIDGAARFDFQSEGVSAGIDLKLSDRMALGVGGGLGRERVDIGTDGSTSRAHNGVGAIYGTFAPVENLFLDAVVGAGALNFDLKRYELNTAGFAEGTRDGTMHFASLAFGMNRRSERLAWQAFGRIEHFGANLDAYTETGAGIWNLTYLERSVTSTASALGASASMNGLKIGTALFSPRLRVEWRHEFDEGAAQGIRYADWLDSPIYSVAASEMARDQLAVGLGAGLRLGDDWAIAADLAGRFDRDTEAGSMRLEVSKRF